MSYTRIEDDSDVYMYKSVADIGMGTDTYCCDFCKLEIEKGHYTADSRENILDHLNDHLLNGNKVPIEAFERLVIEEAIEKKYGYVF